MHIQTDFGGNSLETRDMLKQCPPHCQFMASNWGRPRHKSVILLRFLNSHSTPVPSFY